MKQLSPSWSLTTSLKSTTTPSSPQLSINVGATGAGIASPQSNVRAAGTVAASTVGTPLSTVTTKSVVATQSPPAVEFPTV